LKSVENSNSTYFYIKKGYFYTQKKVTVLQSSRFKIAYISIQHMYSKLKSNTILVHIMYVKKFSLYALLIRVREIYENFSSFRNILIL